MKERGYNPCVYTFPTVKPIDREVIEKIAGEFELIVTCEEHNIVGGFGGAAEVMAESASRKARLLRIGLNDEYSVRVGNQKYLRQQYGMDATAITERIVREVSKDEQ